MKFILFFKSFSYAFRGIKIALLSERNLKIHFFMAIASLTLGYLVGLTLVEWCLLIIIIGLVISLELSNTAIETLCNLICKGEYNQEIKKVKDISAGAVLIVSISAFIVGIIFFAYKVVLWLS